MEHSLQARVTALSNEVRRLKTQLARSRQIEYTLRKNERHYRTLFDRTSVGVAELTTDGKFAAVNLSFCNLVGYTREELLTRSDANLTHPDDLGLDTRFRCQLLSGANEPVQYEKRYLHKNGTTIWASLNLSTIREEGAEAPCILMVVENICERQSLQDSLHRIADNLSRMEAVIPVGSWKWDIRKGKFTGSDEAYPLFGFHKTPLGIPFKMLLDRIHPEDRPMVERGLEATRLSHRPFQLEFRLLLPDGHIRLISSTSEVSRRDRDGKPTVVAGIMHDVTLRRQAEAALRESEQRFRALFDQAGDGIFIANRDGTYTDANASACRMLGYHHDELVGRRITDLIPEEDIGRLTQSRKYFLHSIDNVEVAEWKLKRRDGVFLDTEISARILPDGRWMAIVRDISERKRTQAALEKYAEEVRDLYDNAPCGYHSVDRGDVLTRINNTALEWLGYAREELVGRRRFADLLTAESRESYSIQLGKSRASGRIRDLELDILRKDGTSMPVLLNSASTIDECGELVNSRATLIDLTELSEANRKLRLAAAVFEHTNDAIVITDGSATILAVNKAFSNITGYQPEDVIGKNPRLLKSERHDDEFYRKMWDSIETSGSWRGEIWDRRKSGEIFPVWQNISTVKDVNGKVTEYISVFSDITTIKETEQQLIELAYYDPLTGLANRLLFNDRLGHAIEHAKRHKTRVALLLLDLDRFKLINDTLGHAAGDLLLQAVGRRLAESIRAEDTIARLGGDEFAVVIANIESAEDAALLAEKIVRTVSEPLIIEEQSLAVSASIGISIFPDDAEDRDSLAKAADVAMYGAKEAGRNNYAFYAPAMTDRAAEVLRIDHGLRNALRHGELELYYQPQVNLATGQISGVEALLRWNHPVEGLQTPEHFVPVAEETHLIEDVGEWVVENACRQIAHWSAAGIPPIRVAINLSPRQLKRSDFVDFVRARLPECSLLHHGFGIDLEITEAALQTDPDIVEALHALKALGFRIAIDDFGTGYSSLNSLKQLPIDVLKIDRTFVRGIPDDPDDRAITSAIIAMGHSLGKSIIAEGIETEAQLRFLADQKCDDAQGYLLYIPVPAGQCSVFLSTPSQRAGTMPYAH